MTAFFVLFLYFLVARRPWMASTFAIAMMFSKEIGAAAYAVTIVSYVVAFTLRTPGSWRTRVAELRPQLPLLGPPLALVGYMAFVHIQQPDAGPWLGSYVPIGVIQDRVDMFLNTNLADAGIPVPPVVPSRPMRWLRRA